MKSVIAATSAHPPAAARPIAGSTGSCTSALRRTQSGSLAALCSACMHPRTPSATRRMRVQETRTARATTPRAQLSTRATTRLATALVATAPKIRAHTHRCATVAHAQSTCASCMARCSAGSLATAHASWDAVAKGGAMDSSVFRHLIRARRRVASVEAATTSREHRVGGTLEGAFLGFGFTRLRMRCM